MDQAFDAHLDQAFEALKTYEWGSDRDALDPIDHSIVLTRDDPEQRTQLERRLVEMLKSDISRAATDFVCRKLMVIGTEASVPVLAKLLADPESSHMARYALERIPAHAAGKALREALPAQKGALKIGVIASLGARGEAASVEKLADVLEDSDAAVARAAALALGRIQTAEAAQALLQAQPQDAEVKRAVTDAALACAEAVLAEGKKAPALAIYKKYAGEDQPKHVRLAATRGMLAVAGQ